MNYDTFVTLVKATGWTVAELRCDVPPSEELLRLMEIVGLNYEQFVNRYEESLPKQISGMGFREDCDDERPEASVMSDGEYFSGHNL